MYGRHRDGARAEQRALKFLKRRGLRLVEKNFRCRHGEIDLIMDDDGALVFVEVRYRASGSPVNALETIDPRKQQRLRITAEYYLLRTAQSFSRDCRFDAVAVRGFETDDQVSWIRNAIC